MFIIFLRLFWGVYFFDFYLIDRLNPATDGDDPVERYLNFDPGAIMDAIDCPCSPEPEVMRNAFRSSRTRLDDLVRGSMSGLELAGKGYANDIEVALQVNASNAVPLKPAGAGTPFVEQNLIEAKLP